MKTYEERTQSVQQKLQKRRIHRRNGIIAASLCLCLAVALLAIPFEGITPGLDTYKESEYFEVIKAIDKFQKSNIKNGFSNGDRLYGVGSADKNAVAVPEDAPAMDFGESDGNASVEVTDHQVAGVLEADIIKRSNTHIFYLYGSELRVYPIAGMDTELLWRWELPCQEDVYYDANVEMYLNADATRLILVLCGRGDILNGQDQEFTRVISLDVSDPENIVQAGETYHTGHLISSRVVGEQLMLILRNRIKSQVDFSDESTFLPQYGMPGDMTSIPGGCISVPEELESNFYAVVALLNSADLSLVDAQAQMFEPNDVYISRERIYITGPYGYGTILYGDGGTLRYDDYNTTKVTCVGYTEEGLTDKGCFQVEGWIKDQYFMDEHDGVLRIVAETHRNADGSETYWEAPENADLICLRVDTWEPIAAVEQFAPNGETVESVRFDGNAAYVCTAVIRNFTDPVFFFDLTDLANIQVKDTGYIDGFSSSLVNIGDGLLLGIGAQDRWTFKAEIFRETETGVESVCDFTVLARYPSEYKSYYIDRENKLFGIPTTEGYILLHFTGSELVQLAKPKAVGKLDDIRGLVIDECLYVFSEEFAVTEIAY